MDPDGLPENPQTELPLPDAGLAAPANLEHLQKNLQELQARFQEHAMNTAMAAAEGQEQYVQLRKLLSGTLVALLVLLLGLCVFLAKQMRNVRVQLGQQRPFVLQMVTDFERRIDPNLKSFANQLQTYATAHPDFRPIIDAHRAPLAQYFTLVQPALPAVPILPGLATNPPPAP